MQQFFFLHVSAVCYMAQAQASSRVYLLRELSIELDFCATNYLASAAMLDKCLFEDQGSLMFLHLFVPLDKLALSRSFNSQLIDRLQNSFASVKLLDGFTSFCCHNLIELTSWIFTWRGEIFS